MLAKLSQKTASCHAHAIHCQRRARQSKGRQRREWLVMSARWIKLAESLEFAARISSFLEWNARRLKPPPDTVDDEHRVLQFVARKDKV